MAVGGDLCRGIGFALGTIPSVTLPSWADVDKYLLVLDHNKLVSVVMIGLGGHVCIYCGDVLLV